METGSVRIAGSRGCCLQNQPKRSWFGCLKKQVKTQFDDEGKENDEMSLLWLTAVVKFFVSFFDIRIVRLVVII